jgi:hypothetical protein
MLDPENMKNLQAIWGSGAGTGKKSKKLHFYKYKKLALDNDINTVRITHDEALFLLFSSFIFYRQPAVFTLIYSQA